MIDQRLNYGLALGFHVVSSFRFLQLIRVRILIFPDLLSYPPSFLLFNNCQPFLIAADDVRAYFPTIVGKGPILGGKNEKTILLVDSPQILLLFPYILTHVQSHMPYIGNPVISTNSQHENPKVIATACLKFKLQYFLWAGADTLLQKGNGCVFDLPIRSSLDEEVQVAVGKGSFGVQIFDNDILARHTIIIIQTRVWHWACRGSK